MTEVTIIQLKPIKLNPNQFEFPLSNYTRIYLDHRKPKPNREREHQIVFQKGRNYGTVGDCCHYFDDKMLHELEKNGFIKFVKASKK